MLHRVKDMSPEQRLAVESLLGRRLAADESLSIYRTRILKEAPVGAEREGAGAKLLETLDKIANRVKDVPDHEVEAAIQEACDHVRHA